MPFESLNTLQNQAILYAALQQEALEALTDELGDYEWGVDAQEGTLTFTSKADPTHTIEAGAEVIASIAPGPRSMLWGWSMPQGRTDGYGAQLREYGEQHGIAALTDAEVPFPDQDLENPSAWVAEAAHQIGTVTTAVTGHGPYFGAPIGGDSRAVLLITLDPPLPQPTVASAVAALPRLLSGMTLPDARTSVWGLAKFAGWQLAWTDDQFLAATVSDGGSQANFSFDEQGRLTGVKANLSN